MKRDQLEEFKGWLASEDRLPLVVRGARQVGKTWLIREFAKQEGLRLAELNFERNPEDAGLFRARDPALVLRRVQARLGRTLRAGRSLLFLDEIQAAPELLGSLRWFAEELPELPVVAAGSLLDFALRGAAFSMPVGRIEYRYVEPMSFREFLDATGETGLRDYLRDWSWGEGIPEGLHSRLLRSFRDYVLVGGMPAAVSAWVRSGALPDVSRVHHRLVETFRDDFSKYAPRLPPDRLRRVFDAVPRFLGRKFVFSRVAGQEGSREIHAALDLLFRARACTPVRATHGTGVPLGAEVRERTFKVISLDTGLASAALGLSFENLERVEDPSLVNRGGILEQAVGQALRSVGPAFRESGLFYWARERSGSSAEVDYLVQHGTEILPIEVKAGTTGTLKSLHHLMAARGWRRAVRINGDLPSLTPVDVRTTTGDPARFLLVSLPFYLVEQIHPLLRAEGVEVGPPG